MLLSEVERRTQIVQRFAACFQDHRDPLRIEHSLGELVGQRVLGLCLGYEDLVDHEALRVDPLLCALAGKHERDAKLAGKSTLSRLELSTAGEAAEHRYKKIVLESSAVDRLLVDVFVESFEDEPASIVIDLDLPRFSGQGVWQQRQ